MLRVTSLIHVSALLLSISLRTCDGTRYLLEEHSQLQFGKGTDPVEPPAQRAQAGQTLAEEGLQELSQAARAPPTRPKPATGNHDALKFCNKEGLEAMQGIDPTDSSFGTTDLQQSILEDIANELSQNSVDQMAKDVFSFYMCVRWVPDAIFWSIAKEELTNDIIKTVVEHQKSPEAAISELYQTFKFVPLLCSRNLAVYAERNQSTHTYFPAFQEKVMELSNFLKDGVDQPVWQGLKNVDESFCNSNRMNSAGCDASVVTSEFLAHAQSQFGHAMGDFFKTKRDRWEAMQKIYEGFKYRPDGSQQEWNRDFAGWKSHFPHHSFIAKPKGASYQASPRSTERFLVCFGKRVASDMHRRPRGNNIITDQNSVGCHGWWDAPRVSQMLSRMVSLWKPPTCQLAAKTYQMKKQILRMYSKMNKDLYGALPSMLQDEQVFEQGTMQHMLAGPAPYDVESATLDGKTYYNGMRVAKIKNGWYAKADHEKWTPKYYYGGFTVKHGTGGTIVIDGGTVKVLWDGDVEARAIKRANELQVVPQEYGLSQTGVIDKIGGALTVAGQAFQDMFKSKWADSYSNLAELMSGSLTKWVVCGVAADANYDELDSWLGTEDEALSEHVQEAYSKWTGYQAKIPGEECSVDPLVDQMKFPKCRVCDFSELHEDHPERYWRENGEKEKFMCPLVPPMSPPDQLSVFKQKKRQCLLHMTAEHQRQFQWHYQGHHPARKQNNLQDNNPRTEYQLVQLLDIFDEEGPQQVSFGRSCTIEEKNANPRFCRTPELQEKWPSLSGMAESVSAWLGGALGMPTGAVSSIISNYQRMLSKNVTNGQKAVALTEEAYDSLLGLGRLAHSTLRSAGNEVLYRLPEEQNRHARLERELFGSGHAGELLHGSSFQAPMGASGTSSNSRNRFRRYAVVCDCDDFDPGLELALRWKWSQMALRIIREAVRHRPRILKNQVPVVEVRSEARLFQVENRETANSTFFTYGASIRAKIREESRWKTVWDGKLAQELGGNPIGQGHLSTLKALSVRFYCGKKSAFGATGGPTPLPDNFRKCIQDGVKANAAMKAAEPWRLYFPDEVIVVAEFGTFDRSLCLSTHPSTAPMVCGGDAMVTPGLDLHLDEDAKSGGVSGGQYRGMRTGAGFPKGTVKEVTVKPEDILSVNGLLLS